MDPALCQTSTKLSPLVGKKNVGESAPLVGVCRRLVGEVVVSLRGFVLRRVDQ